MRTKAYLNALLVPFVLWFVFYVVAFLFGYTEYPDVTQQMMLNNASPYFVALAFGLWIGAESYNNGFRVGGAAVNALIASFVVGVFCVLFTIVLINTSQIFLAYAASLYSKAYTVNQPILNLAISTWVGNIFTAIPAAAATCAFLKGRKK